MTYKQVVTFSKTYLIENNLPGEAEEDTETSAEQQHTNEPQEQREHHSRLIVDSRPIIVHVNDRVVVCLLNQISNQ